MLPAEPRCLPHAEYAPRFCAFDVDCRCERRDEAPRVAAAATRFASVALFDFCYLPRVRGCGARTRRRCRFCCFSDEAEQRERKIYDLLFEPSMRFCLLQQPLQPDGARRLCRAVAHAAAAYFTRHTALKTAPRRSPSMR